MQTHAVHLIEISFCDEIVRYARAFVMKKRQFRFRMGTRCMILNARLDRRHWKRNSMSTPDEQRTNLEPNGAGGVLPDEGLQPLETTQERGNTFQETERLLFELLATIGHEFRTPLAVIEVYTSMLLGQAQHISKEEQREFLQMIRAAGKRLQILTD